MDYEGQICRAPIEKGSFMLPVAVGCSYNACKFCMLFKHLRFRELPLDQVEQEILRVKSLGADPEKVYLGDGNAFDLSAERLLTILDMVHKHFPGCKTVNMDATISNIAAKSDEELQALAEAGVCCLYLGIESGLDDVLKFMAKDHDLAEAYAQIARIQKAGMTYAAHIMTGIAGKGRGAENAEATAEFLNRTHPAYVCNFSMMLHKDAPVYKDIEAGRFYPADELEVMQEEYGLISLIDTELIYEATHDSENLHLRGSLPADREKLLARTAEVIADLESKTHPVYVWGSSCACREHRFEIQFSKTPFEKPYHTEVLPPAR